MNQNLGPLAPEIALAASAVAGLLLSGSRAADLLALYAAVGSDPPPTAFAVPSTTATKPMIQVKAPLCG